MENAGFKPARGTNISLHDVSRLASGAHPIPSFEIYRLSTASLIDPIGSLASIFIDVVTGKLLIPCSCKLQKVV